MQENVVDLIIYVHRCTIPI